MVTGSASSATANITPLTEMVTAKLLATDPATYFAAFNATNATNAASITTTSAVPPKMTSKLEQVCC